MYARNNERKIIIICLNFLTFCSDGKKLVAAPNNTDKVDFGHQR